MKKIICIVFLFLYVFESTSQVKYPDSEKDGKYVTVNGAKIWVVTIGDGDPMILISGGPGSAHVYLRRFDSLAADNMLVYFDAFGRGKADTAKDIKEYTLERDIEDIEGLRNVLHL